MLCCALVTCCFPWQSSPWVSRHSCAQARLWEPSFRPIASERYCARSWRPFEVPRYTAAPGSMTFRTQVFEPLAIAALAWLLPGQATPNWLGHASRYLLIVSFIVFGVDHFLALAPIGTLIPPWIPWHVFWIAFFGTGFVAAGLSLAFNFL